MTPHVQHPQSHANAIQPYTQNHNVPIKIHTCSEAMATRAATGLPPYVEPCWPRPIVSMICREGGQKCEGWTVCMCIMYNSARSSAHASRQAGPGAAACSSWARRNAPASGGSGPRTRIRPPQTRKATRYKPKQANYEVCCLWYLLTSLSASTADTGMVPPDKALPAGQPRGGGGDFVAANSSPQGGGAPPGRPNAGRLAQHPAAASLPSRFHLTGTTTTKEARTQGVKVKVQGACTPAAVSQG